jgi:predicted dehydrogenase
MKNSGRLRVGIIGTGWGARVQVPAFREAGIEVVAISGRDREKTARTAQALGIDRVVSAETLPAEMPPLRGS